MGSDLQPIRAGRPDKDNSLSDLTPALAGRPTDHPAECKYRNNTPAFCLENRGSDATGHMFRRESGKEEERKETRVGVKGKGTEKEQGGRFRTEKSRHLNTNKVLVRAQTFSRPLSVRGHLRGNRLLAWAARPRKPGVSRTDI